MKQHPPNGPYDGRKCDVPSCPCHPTTIWKSIKDFWHWYWREWCKLAAMRHGIYPDKKDQDNGGDNPE